MYTLSYRRIIRIIHKNGNVQPVKVRTAIHARKYIRLYIIYRNCFRAVQSDILLYNGTLKWTLCTLLAGTRTHVDENRCWKIVTTEIIIVSLKNKNKWSRGVRNVIVSYNMSIILISNTLWYYCSRWTIENQLCKILAKVDCALSCRSYFHFVISFYNNDIMIRIVQLIEWCVLLMSTLLYSDYNK